CDSFSHLTNYSFQKHNNNFGKYEKGNEVSFDDLQYNIQEELIVHIGRISMNSPWTVSGR
ncbi:MAG: hypothetical protein IIU49_06085, partial [Spirochaetales bacterium]|nr:hypothetical protein [Spirochaetales bacterium]